MAQTADRLIPEADPRDLHTGAHGTEVASGPLAM